MTTSNKWLFSILLLLVVAAGATFLIVSRKSSTAVYSQKGSDANMAKTEAPVNSSTNTNTSSQSGEVSFLAGGDIMLSRNVAAEINKTNKDANWPFRNIQTLLKSTDFNFANLESPYSGSDDFPATGSLVFNAPTWTFAGLTKNNFKVLNLANNHASDQGKAGLLYTKKLLTDAGIVNIGTGANQTEAWQGQVYEVNGVRIGFIGASYASVNDGGKTKNDYVARMEDTAKLKASITDLKSKSDFIVVTMHGGIEYTRTPNAIQTNFAHAAIDDGADIVIGAHPHWVQTTETYKGKPIFYSLGNFVFDQMFSQDTKEGLTLKLTIDKTDHETKLKEIKLIPIIIENYGQPRLANSTESDSILKKIILTNSTMSF